MQVVAEIRSALRDEFFEVTGEREGRVLGALHHDGVRRRIRADRVRGLGRPRGEGLTVGQRHAEHLADDGRWHRQSEIGDHVDLVALGDRIEAGVGDARRPLARQRSIARGVNAWLTSFRSRVCAGGSWKSMNCARP